MVKTLAKLEEIDVRSIWKHEQYDFSTWLAQPENLDELGNIIGLTLTDVQTETFVGAYRADIVARDETSNIKVIIENQLESTNHDHLGKIITYAAGTDADVIVWIVKNGREEHRAAIEWLNQKTVDGVSFFLIEIHAYRIGDSPSAAKFELIEKPNDFTKALNRKGDSSELTRIQAERMEFWTLLNETLSELGKPFNPRKVTSEHWYNVALGTSEAHLSISLLNKSNEIAVEVYIPDSKNLFDRLKEYREQIKTELDFDLDWQRLDAKKASRIRSLIPGLDFSDHVNYPLLINQVIARVVQMRDVFKQYL